MIRQSSALNDFFSEPAATETPKPHVLQTLAWLIPVVGTIVSISRQDFRLAVFVFLSGLVVVVPMHGTAITKSIRKFLLNRTRNRVAVQSKSELKRFYGRFLECTNNSRSDSLES